MTDLFWTIVTSWIIWRLWSFFANNRTVHIQKNEFNHFTHHHYSTTNPEFKHEKCNKFSTHNDGEYIEFEEVKK